MQAAQAQIPELNLSSGPAPTGKVNICPSIFIDTFYYTVVIAVL